MKKYVIFMEEATMARNGKTDAMVSGLLEKICQYGRYEDYDRHMATRDVAWQKEIDGVKAELTKAKSVACADEFELAVVKACRMGVDNAVAVVNAEKEKYRVELENHKGKLETLRANISAVLGE